MSDKKPNEAINPLQEQKQNSSIGTPYDDVYRTMQNDCRKWCIPMVNEAFQEQYTGDEQIIPAPNEHFINWQDGGSAKRITDSSFTILGRDGLKMRPRKYHFECESNPDGSIQVRLFEYDSQIALDDAQVEGFTMTVTFPRSAVLFLRHNKNTPDWMKMVIRTEGGEISYDIPIIKVQDYTLEEIFEKKLLFFIPFYIFRYEKDLPQIEKELEGAVGDAASRKLVQLESDYTCIRSYLDGMCDKGQLTEFEKRTIIDMSKKVLNGIAFRQPKVKEGVNRFMGGNVLDYEAKDILRQGISQGLEQGTLRKLLQQVCRKLAKGKSLEMIADELEEEPAIINGICAIASKYAPDYDVEKILAEYMQAENAKNEQ